VPPSIDSRIDELYQLPLAEFTAARNALAKSLGGADGQRVRHLEKPTVVPWAVNQLYWQARKVYDRLLESGEALRSEQIAALKGRKSDVRAAAEAHRAAVAKAVAEATKLAEANNAHPGAEPLSRMLEAVSLAPKHPGKPGRLTDVVQPAGFEALLGVGAMAPPRARPPESERREEEKPKSADLRSARGRPHEEPEKEKRARLAEEKRRRAEEARHAREAAARQREQAAARKRAEAGLARAEQQAAAARRDFDRAEQKLRDAERAVSEAKAALGE